MRDRLIELLSENFVDFCHVVMVAGNCKISAVTLEADKFADHLIANGVVVREKGEWMPALLPSGVQIEDEVYATLWECPVCSVMDFYYNFCPNCGADMRKGENG